MTINDFINSSGRVSSTKSNEKWVSKNFPEDFEKIKNHTKKIGLIPISFSEEIYHYINNLKKPYVCKECGINKPKFNGLLNGYQEYCSSKCSNSSKDVKNKKKISYVKKYGVDNPSKSKVVIEKIQETFNSKYGGNPLKLESFRKKIEETNIERYGEKSPMKRGSLIREKIEERKISDFLKKYEHLEIIDFENNKNGEVIIKCQKCQNEFSISKWNLHQRNKFNVKGDICTICNPIGNITESKIELFIEDFLIESNLKYDKNNRKIISGKEIDFYIPEAKIGIEVNGLFWHSDKFKESYYHLNKTKEAESKGILLIHIFEDEILYKPETVKSRLRSIFGLNENRIFARNCKIKEISKKESGKFMKENHLQGNAGCNVSFGLYYNENLVSVMTFGGLRKSLGSNNKNGHWELIRFCNKANTSVIGGASKLFNKFIEKYKPENVISYCDRRWSNGDFYTKIGFTLDSETKPNYYYFKNGIRESRFKYRKDVLVKMGFSPDKSESEIMLDRGYMRIYDCGSYKFKWIF